VDVAAVRLFVMAVAGWWADQRQASFAYLIEENRIPPRTSARPDPLDR
jgi:hypothetical protein